VFSGEVTNRWYSHPRAQHPVRDGLLKGLHHLIDQGGGTCTIAHRLKEMHRWRLSYQYSFFYFFNTVLKILPYCIFICVDGRMRISADTSFDYFASRGSYDQ
jgi:hypothetical protein